MRTIEDLLACDDLPELSAKELALVKAELAVRPRLLCSEVRAARRAGRESDYDLQVRRRDQLKKMLLFNENLPTTASAATAGGKVADDAGKRNTPPAVTRPKPPHWTKAMSKEARASAVLVGLKKDPGMSDADLARKLCISVRTVQNWKNDPTMGKAWAAASRAVLPPRAVADARKGGHDVLDPDSPEQNRMRR